METNLKKLLPMVGVMLASFTLVSADQFNSDDTTGSTDANGKYRACPSANHMCDDAWGVFAFGEYILWTPRAQLVAGTSGIYTGGIQNANAVQGSALQPSFHLLSGFRVGLGVTHDHDQWDTKIDYTWLRQNPSMKTLYSVSDDVDSTAYATFPLSTVAASFDPQIVTSVASEWQYHFNNIDLDSGRDFFVGHYFALRPHAGFKFAWTRNWFNNTYTTTDSTVTWHVNSSQKFWGVGLRAGLDPTFYFNDSWMIFSTTALSLPWSKFSIDQSTVNTTTSETYVTFGNTYYTVAPVLEVALGLRWAVKFGDNDCYAFALQTGWEEQVWFNQVNWVSAPNSLGQGGDLTQQGLTVRARFDF